MSLRLYETNTLTDSLERCISLDLHKEADIIRFELGLRNKINPQREDMIKLLQGKRYNFEY
jgi:hypothetical protein